VKGSIDVGDGIVYFEYVENGVSGYGLLVAFLLTFFLSDLVWRRLIRCIHEQHLAKLKSLLGLM
jgi:hypothetical protein